MSDTLRCRGSRNRGRSSTSTLASSRRTISGTLIVRARAAAISMASGRPSSRRHSSTTAAGRRDRRRRRPGTLEEQLHRRARLVTSRSGGDGQGRGQHRLAGQLEGERLVASTVGCWQASRTAGEAWAAASSRCSQLSTTRSTGRSAGGAEQRVERVEAELGGERPGTPVSSSTRVRSTWRTPIENIGAARTAPARGRSCPPLRGR